MTDTPARALLERLVAIVDGGFTARAQSVELADEWVAICAETKALLAEPVKVLDVSSPQFKEREARRKAMVTPPAPSAIEAARDAMFERVNREQVGVEGNDIKTALDRLVDSLDGWTDRTLSAPYHAARARVLALAKQAQEEGEKWQRLAMVHFENAEEARQKNQDDAVEMAEKMCAERGKACLHYAEEVADLRLRLKAALAQRPTREEARDLVDAFENAVSFLIRGRTGSYAEAANVVRHTHAALLAALTGEAP